MLNVPETPVAQQSVATDSNQPAFLTTESLAESTNRIVRNIYAAVMIVLLGMIVVLVPIITSPSNGIPCLIILAFLFLFTVYCYIKSAIK
jgi:hypothetical protein